MDPLRSAGLVQIGFFRIFAGRYEKNMVRVLIEPVLMAEDRWSPLYDDVMRTGILV